MRFATLPTTNAASQTRLERSNNSWDLKPPDSCHALKKLGLYFWSANMVPEESVASFENRSDTWFWKQTVCAFCRDVLFWTGMSYVLWPCSYLRLCCKTELQILWKWKHKHECCNEVHIFHFIIADIIHMHAAQMFYCTACTIKWIICCNCTIRLCPLSALI